MLHLPRIKERSLDAAWEADLRECPWYVAVGTGRSTGASFPHNNRRTLPTIRPPCAASLAQLDSLLLPQTMMKYKQRQETLSWNYRHRRYLWIPLGLMNLWYVFMVHSNRQVVASLQGKRYSQFERLDFSPILVSGYRHDAVASQLFAFDLAPIGNSLCLALIPLRSTVAKSDSAYFLSVSREASVIRLDS